MPIENYKQNNLEAPTKICVQSKYFWKVYYNEGVGKALKRFTSYGGFTTKFKKVLRKLRKW